MPEPNDPRLTLPPGGTGTRLQVSANIASMQKTAAPDSVQVSQLLFGETVIQHSTDGPFALVQNEADRYVGWVRQDALSDTVHEPTHRVKAALTHLYPKPSVKTPPTSLLSLGAQVTTSGDTDGRYLQTAQGGWLIDDHLQPVERAESDPASVALRFMSAPYLWGGRDTRGVDCSGLTQLAFAACGVALPRDSDMQAAWTGTAIPDWTVPGALNRNDLVFWDGHVGIMQNSATLLHANGHHMATASEPLEQAVERIAKLYGEPTQARRINLESEKNRIPSWLTARQ